jgi:two-component system C4-dicarboxylate transport sensor histidine kinase DctB
MREALIAVAMPRICLVHEMTDLPSLVNTKERPETGSTALHSAHWFVRGAMALVLVVAASWLGYAAAFHRGLADLHAAAQQRLAVEVARLDGHLSRFEYLPSLLETSPDVFRLLGDPTDPALQHAVSLYLKSINLLAGADNLYVLTVSGEALAAADFDQAGTPVGMNLSYRPYMSEALASGRGAFFGVGITSARAGYYLSYALKQGGLTRGVAVVKVNLESFEREWSDRANDLVLVDRRGVTILASKDDWRFRPLATLSPEARGDIARSKPYGNSELKPLGWTVLADGDRVAAEDGSTYSIDERWLNGNQWRLILLGDERPMRQTASVIGGFSGLAGIATLLALGLFEQR